MMKLNVFKMSKWLSAWTAVATMVATPLAMAKESESLKLQTLQMALEQTGLNKPMTFGEFFEKNKASMPERIQKEMAPVVAKYRNQKMPQIELASTKNTDGSEVPTMRVSKDGQLFNLQWFGQEDKYLKFQNTNLSRIDLNNFTDMVERIMAGDENMRKGVQPLVSMVGKPAEPRGFDFAKFPEMTKRDWDQMSQFDRANYIVNLRLLWQDARKVLAEKKKFSKTKKTVQSPFKKNEKLLEFLFGQEVNAAPGSSCIVAGYVASYDKQGGEFCNHDKINHVYQQGKSGLYMQAKEACEKEKSGSIACNPFVFGTPSGKPTCVTPSRTDDSFQRATHWDGPCDNASKLSSSKVNVVNKDREGGRYDVGNLISEEDRKKQIFQKGDGPANLQLTEDYLLGVLKFKKSVGANVKSLFDNGVLDEEVLKQVKNYDSVFKQEIAEANASCKTESDAANNKKIFHEKNYWKACDQLHSRFLFTEALFASKCDVGSNLNQSTLKCTCTAPAGLEILPGSKCTTAGLTPPVVTNPPVNPPAKPPKEICIKNKFGSVGSQLDANCKCPGGTDPVMDASDGKQSNYSCNSKDDDKDKEDVKKECGFGCTFMKNIVPIGLAIAATLAIFWAVNKLFAVKKPPLNNPGDGCTTGVTACATTCKAPTSMQASGCACAPCIAGQSGATIANSCTCSTTTTTTTTLYICPDGINSRTDISQCPYYTCNTTTPPTSYQNPSNCPAVSTSGATSTGAGGKTR